MTKLLAWLTGQPIEKVAEYFAERLRLKQQLRIAKLEGTIEVEKAKLAAEAAAAERTHEWEIARIRDAGYKDEWVLGLISVPLVGCFIPGLQPHVLKGFGVLAETPYWYVSMIVAIFLAIYGIRWKRAAEIRVDG